MRLLEFLLRDVGDADGTRGLESRQTRTRGSLTL
jgi:hypothetical protein